MGCDGYKCFNREQAFAESISFTIKFTLGRNNAIGGNQFPNS
jgi:hypothetical protein